MGGGGGGGVTRWSRDSIVCGLDGTMRLHFYEQYRR